MKDVSVSDESSLANWPYRLSEHVSDYKLQAIQAKVEELAKEAQYGWGHTIDFGPFQKGGILGNSYLRIAGLLDSWSWWPPSFEGWTVADVGCFTGGFTLLMADRKPEIVYAIDEIPEHLAQCDLLCELFDIMNVRTLQTSLYSLGNYIPNQSVDLILLSGVLYHLSDMLVAMLVCRAVLKPMGVMIIESNAVEDWEQSYANFGRFFAGMWWQPSALCISDMCEFTGFTKPEIRFYKEQRCLARTERTEEDAIPFKRGLNLSFDTLRDARARSMDPGIMAPVRYENHP